MKPTTITNKAEAQMVATRLVAQWQMNAEFIPDLRKDLAKHREDTDWLVYRITQALHAAAQGQPIPHTAPARAEICGEAAS